MMVRAPDASGPEKSSILGDIVAQVLAMGATRFEVDHDYGQAKVWAVKGPVDLSLASFQPNSAKAVELATKLHDLKKNQNPVVVNGNEYLLGVEIFDSSGQEGFRVSITRARNDADLAGSETSGPKQE